MWAGIRTNKRWVAEAKTAKDKHPHVFRWISTLESSGSNVAPAVVHAHARMTQKADDAQKQKSEKSKAGSFDIDLPNAEMGKVVTRFPPEPSGTCALRLRCLRYVML